MEFYSRTGAVVPFFRSDSKGAKGEMGRTGLAQTNSPILSFAFLHVPLDMHAARLRRRQDVYSST